MTITNPTPVPETPVEAPKPTPPAVVDAPAAPVQLPDDHPLVKTLAAQKEQMKELRAKATRLDEIEEAQKTEAQKLLERAEAAEKLAAEAQAKALRAEIAAAKGVPVELLKGSTAEALEKEADALLAFKGTTPPPPVPSADGQGELGTPIGGGKQLTSEDLKGMSPQEIIAAQEAGLLRDLLGHNT